MFLKKIEMKGFKSFADAVVINFDRSVTGIVGPNGCGKSNISDAIRWVLGEQSVKSMRGTSMTDVIFNGSENRRKVNMAEVTLHFNNEHKVLNNDFEEVEITRRLYRDTRESQYFINKVPCRLRDIHDLVMDTGLGRDSLSIISQGSISHFAEAKPDERRLVFEEAAGVSKYKKRKIESINKLERTKENIDRMQDIVDEIEKQVRQLKRASEKALLYKEYKEELESIEISLLVFDIEKTERDIDQLKQELYEQDAQLAQKETEISVLEHDLESKRTHSFEMDQEMQLLQDELMHLVQKIARLEQQEVELKERRKYQLNLGDPKERLKALKESLEEAHYEYDERLKRFNELSQDKDRIELEVENLKMRLDKQEQKHFQLEMKLQKLRQTQEQLMYKLNRPFEKKFALQTLIDQREHLTGVLDAVANVIQIEAGYEDAIETSLGGMLYYIITEDDQSAVDAINFLKRNKAGRASFIPLSSVKERRLNSDGLMICEHDNSFLGLASEFVTYDTKYEQLILDLLGQVIIASNIDGASRLARKLKYRYKIVTLEGDVIHRGGVLSGGSKRRQRDTPLSTQKELNLLEEKINRLNKEIEAFQKFQSNEKNNYEMKRQVLMQKRITLAQMEPLLDVKRSHYEKLKTEYLEVSQDSIDLSNFHKQHKENPVLELTMNRDEIKARLSFLREERYQFSKQQRSLEEQLRNLRQEMNQLSKNREQIALKLVQKETQFDNLMDRLSSTYQMTFEYAQKEIYDEKQVHRREELVRLRKKIDRLGNINLQAPEQYVETKERFDFLEKQLNDLLLSRQKLLDLIEDLDEIMIEQFSDMFDRVNDELQDVFSSLFGGGTARLVLVDPDDVLNTGVDIDVQPPGKSVQNIRLFSGGEKSLIAISVLFSIIKARHVPLCVFDEVEAALDQANVERLANYIQSLSDETQFIIITHRPGTMSQCDILYGVTMPDKGVSTLLKVQLDEAIELKEG